EEGRAARNLIAWSVPLESKEEEGEHCRGGRKNAGLDAKPVGGAMLDKAAEKSPTKARPPRKVDLRARYWAFLFDNLRRAVDEIYVTCEWDQSVVECKEVLMMLDNYVRDFKALIDWIQLQEKLEKTDAQNRPTSLAWEVRKMSPGRHVVPSPSTERILSSPNARRSLNFGGPPPTLATARLPLTGPSWADRVKSSQTLAVPTHGGAGVEKDAEGWETVQRGRPAKPRSAAMVAKVSPVLANACLRDDSNMENRCRGHAPRNEDPRPIGQGKGADLLEESGESEKAQDIEVLEHLSLKKYIVDIVTDSSITVETTKDGEEKQKARRKAKKLRARMNSRAKEYEISLEAKTQIPESPYKAKLQRLVKDLMKQLQGQDSGQWGNNRVSSLDRTLGEVSRILEKQNNTDQVVFQVGGGLSALEQILQVAAVASSPTSVLRFPLKSLCAAVNTYYLACSNCYANCIYILFSNKITFLMDVLLHQLTLYIPDEDKSVFGRSLNKQVFEGLTTGLLQTSAAVLKCLLSHPAEEALKAPRPSVPVSNNQLLAGEPFNSRVQDLISYVVNMGLIDKLYSCFLSVQGSGDENLRMTNFLHQATELLHAMCRLCYVVTGRSPGVFDKRQDPTGLTSVLRTTDLVGVLHMLYCVLLHGSPPEPAPTGPPEVYTTGVILVALQSVRFLNSFALLDLPAFQSVLGAEGLSLAFRHIISSLLWYCSQNQNEELLHEVIICVGYFTVNHPDNQVIVQSGRQPSVLQKLCQLPFQYFSDPRLIKVLFPTLISACYNNPQNKVILQQEMSCVLLATFIQVPGFKWKKSDRFIPSLLRSFRRIFFVSYYFAEIPPPPGCEYVQIHILHLHLFV
uniref:S-phase cyclin A-associated protein in the ER n=1 Tax=Scleropages formosus TaxID=113540 RepID=A0A8C9W7L6_SCLFO